jgi:hypothetical protein
MLNGLIAMEDRTLQRSRRPSELVIGRVVAVDPDVIQTLVPVTADAVELVKVHQSLIVRSSLKIGDRVALMFECGDGSRPIIMGRIEADIDQVESGSPRLQQTRDRDTVIESAGSLTLRCGRAHIELHQDGRISVRGTSITSRASRTQTIRGASVQIN